MIHICVHKFKDGKMVVPEPCFTVKELNAQFDKLAQASRDRNWAVINDIIAGYGKACRCGLQLKETAYRDTYYCDNCGVISDYIPKETP